MAATSTAIPAADLAARALDAPALMALNVCQVAYDAAAANFVTNQTGTLAAGDTSATGLGRERLVKRHRHLKWNGASGTTHFVILDLGSIVHDCDTLAIEGHNLDGATITVEADDATLPTEGTAAWGTQVFNFVQSGNGTIYLLHATTMYRARYWRIKIVAAAAFVPQATQVWIGKSLQIPARALIDSDLPSVAGGAFIEHETKGRVVYRYRNHGSLIARAVSFLIAQAFTSTFFIDLATFMTGANHLDGGMRSFWWCDEPTTAPGSALFVNLSEPMHRPRSRGPATSFSLEWKEVGS